jgi:Ala-tRNA(Pro) deacylase
MISTKLKEFLDNAGVSYTIHPHRPACTSQEIAESLHTPGREIVKSVILRADERQIVAVLSANDAANLETLREEIGCGVLLLASESEFRDAFPTCKLGAMPPFGNIFNLPTYCEVNLSQNRDIEFNAGTYDETIRMRFEDYRRLVKPNMVHFAQPYRKGVQRLAVRASGKASQSLEITDQERNLLLELIEGAERAAIQSVDHADTRDFKELLRNRLHLLDSVRDKLQSHGTQAA